MLLWVALTLPLANEVWTNPQTELLVWVFPLGLLVWLVFHQHWAVRLFTRNRLLGYVGTHSYSLYLWHWLILQAILLRFVPDMHMTGTRGLLLRVAVLLPLSLGVSMVSYRFIEQPGIRCGRRWIARYTMPSPRRIPPNGDGGESASVSR
ncbi:MAG: acyltransferase family protein [Sulfobacillus sp.]